MDAKRMIRDAFSDEGVELAAGFRLRIPSYPARIKFPPGTKIVGPIGLMSIGIDGLDVTPDEVRVVVDGLPDMRFSL